MRFLSTRAHGVIDYAMGFLLIASPWLFRFADTDRRAAVYVPVILGIAVLMTSLMTAYELGAVKLISMPAHLGADTLVGLVLIASPWVFGFADRVWMPHVILGVLELGVVLVSQTRPGPDAMGVHTPGHGTMRH